MKVSCDEITMQYRLVLSWATILTGRCRDRVSLRTNLPHPTDGDLYFEFLLPRGSGAAYIRQHFPDLEIRMVQR